MGDHRLVREGTVTVSYSVFEHPMDDGKFKYEWYDDAGNDSYELFDSADEAEADARRSLGE